MSGTVCTCNMAEALYLFQRGNRVVKVEMACSWPYGLEEFAILFEGENAETDHERYIAHGLPVNLCALPDLFAAVAAVLPKGGAA